MPSELEIASTLARRGFKGGSAVDAVRVITNPEFCGIRENLEVGEIGQRYCRWPEDTITWTIRDTLSALGEKMRLGCEAALADISSYFQLDFPYVERADEANILITVAPLGGPMGVLADCQLVPCNIGDKNNVQMLMRADRSEQWVWANTPSGMAIDWQRVFAHEWVHGLGLPHIKTPNSLLNPTYNPRIRGLQPGDIDLLVKLGLRLRPKAAPTPPQPSPGEPALGRVDYRRLTTGVAYTPKKRAWVLEEL
jgi:hypothetical protein